MGHTINVCSYGISPLGPSSIVVPGPTVIVELSHYLQICFQLSIHEKQVRENSEAVMNKFVKQSQQ